MKKDLPACPVEITMGLIGEKWKVLIIRDLLTGTKRFGELRKSVTGIMQKVLTNNLRQMEASGLVKRKVYAEKLSSLIVEKLVKLELPCAKFEIAIKDKPNCSQGKDDVEFLITTNVSSPLMPLAKVASGGEISRVMLAIKTVFATVDLLSTVIFDEIDTGISGKASGAVADAICDLAQNMQVFAITHQPIIASKANAHFKVEKVQDEKTNVSARKLQTEEEKLQALASLASGEISEASVSLAKELLERK